MKPAFLGSFLLFSAFSPAQTLHPKHAIAPHPLPQTAQAIHQSALIVDTHADTSQRFLDERFDSLSLGEIEIMLGNRVRRHTWLTLSTNMASISS
jgi:hypothetical protein